MHVFFVLFLGVYGSLRSKNFLFLLSEKIAGKEEMRGKGKANEVR